MRGTYVTGVLELRSKESWFGLDLKSCVERFSKDGDELRMGRGLMLTALCFFRWGQSGRYLRLNQGFSGWICHCLERGWALREGPSQRDDGYRGK